MVVAAALAACGFHLRGSVAVPFDTLYIPNAKSGIALELKRNIEAGTSVKVVDDAKAADAVLELTGENREKIILSLTGKSVGNGEWLRCDPTAPPPADVVWKHH